MYGIWEIRVSDGSLLIVGNALTTLVRATHRIYHQGFGESTVFEDGESPIEPASTDDFPAVGEAITFGVWELYVDESYLTIWGEGQGRGLAMWNQSNGWMGARIGGTLLTLWSTGAADPQTIVDRDIAGAQAAVSLGELADGDYVYGTWEIRVHDGTLEIRHLAVSAVKTLVRDTYRIQHEGSSETTVFEDRDGQTTSPVGDFLATGEAVTFGVWKLYNNGSYLTILGAGQDRALALLNDSSGWIDVKIGADLFTLWSAGDHSSAEEFLGHIIGARDAVLSGEMGNGHYVYGTWEIDIEGAVWRSEVA